MVDFLNGIRFQSQSRIQKCCVKCVSMSVPLHADSRLVRICNFYVCGVLVITCLVIFNVYNCTFFYFVRN